MTHVALKACHALEKEGICPGLLDVHSLRPLSEKQISGKIFLINSPGESCHWNRSFSLSLLEIKACMRINAGQTL